jgi:CBS domain-containing protein
MQFYAKDIMSDSVITVRPEMSSEEVKDLFTSHKISGAPVVDHNGQLIGVITMHDLLKSGLDQYPTLGYFEQVQLDRALAQQGLHIENISAGFVSDFMTREVFTAEPEMPVEELARLMYRNRIHRVIVVNPDEAYPVGIVTTFDMLKMIASGNTLQEVLPKSSLV